MELTPRTLDEESEGESQSEQARPARRRSSRRRWIPLGVVGALVLILAVVVYKGLNEATVYFRNADEAVAEREELGDRRFRLQGSVVDDAVSTDDGVNFDVTYNGATVAVHHVGDPPELFKPEIPVVLEGRWDPSGEFFASDRMLIKHDADYESRDDYEKRIAEAEQ